jgi:hypothetical protein
MTYIQTIQDNPAGGYASLDDLSAFIYVDTDALDPGSQRLLDRASELVSYFISNHYRSGNTNHATAAKQATCAQVEYWLDQGEESVMQGNVQRRQIGKTDTQYFAGGQPVLCPRAVLILIPSGLLYQGVRSAGNKPMPNTPNPFDIRDDYT